MDKIFANVMIYFRKRAHLTQSEVAIKTGITQSAVSKLEDGVYWPNKITVSKFCEGVGISANEFCLYMGLQLIATALKSIIWFSYDEEED